MITLGYILCAIGSIIGLVYGIQLLIVGCKESVLWGLGYLFALFVALIFVIKFWDRTKSLFLRCLILISFYVIGGGLIFAGYATQAAQAAPAAG